jgi:hypothetical protein
MHIHRLEAGRQDVATWRIPSDYVPFSVSLDPITPSGGLHVQALHIRQEIYRDPELNELYHKARLGLTMFNLGSEPKAAVLWTWNGHEGQTPLPAALPIMCPQHAEATIQGELQSLFDMAVDLTAVSVFDHAVQDIEQRVLLLDIEDAQLKRDAEAIRPSLQIEIVIVGPHSKHIGVYKRRMEEIQKRRKEIQEERERATHILFVLEKARSRREMSVTERREYAERLRHRRQSFSPPRP